MYDVVGISHPLIDLCADIEDEFLELFSLKKGVMHVVDSKRFMEVHEKIDKNKMKIEFGGSVSNTLDGLRLLGCKVAEYGKIGMDKYGDLLVREKEEKKMGNFLKRHKSPTGCVLALITPDAQRTFVVCYGAATKLNEEDIDTEIIKNSKIIHFTGYEFESPLLRLVIKKVVSIAKPVGVLISFDLADIGVIQRNYIALKQFIAENVDILFANEAEAEAFTGKPGESALALISENVNYAVLKLGEKGSMISTKNSGNIYRIRPVKVIPKDTTGAGDIYASCILYGILKNIPLDKAGRIASYAAAKVVEKKGARLAELDLSEII
jgi:sugar/nucleoside kinase (ribokinase family)